MNVIQDAAPWVALIAAGLATYISLRIAPMATTIQTHENKIIDLTRRQDQLVTDVHEVDRTMAGIDAKLQALHETLDRIERKMNGHAPG
jgi:peptidoglycan hydrolase CwlO-like protein